MLMYLCFSTNDMQTDKKKSSDMQFVLFLRLVGYMGP